MSSEDEDMDSEEEKSDLPRDIPPLSKDKYIKAYEFFQRWNLVKGATPVTQSVLIKYFTHLAEKHKPSTLWAYYSMIKATLRINDNIDITSWSKVRDFLKRKKAGYKPAKVKLFTEDQIEKFLFEAPDSEFLDIKVICIFALNGASTGNKLVNIKVEHIKKYDDMIWVIIPNTETKHSFTISGTLFNIVQKYAALRPKNTADSRFFVHYIEGKCTEQPYGKNRFNQATRKIAKYLKLRDTDSYTGFSFRLPSVTDFLRRHSVSVPSANRTMPNTDACNSTSVAEKQSVLQSDRQKEYSLDYETGQYMPVSPTVSCTTPPVSAGSSYNDLLEHECTPSCSQVKCNKEGNEKNAFHAFSVVKSSDYAITEIIPAQFSSDPTCRWIVAYSHFVEPVSVFNSDEKFAEITRTLPTNVRVIQKYVRCKSSQLFAAYVVVYGVKCRCQKPIFGPVTAQPVDKFGKKNVDPLSEHHSNVFGNPSFDPLSAKP